MANETDSIRNVTISNETNNDGATISNGMTNSTVTTVHPFAYRYVFDPVSGYYFPRLLVTDTTIWIVTSSVFLFACIGLFLYLHICHVILKNRKTVFANPFYILILYLAVPDCVYLLVQVTFGCLITVVGFLNVSFTLVAVIGVLCQFTMNCVFYFVALMGLNRYLAICHYAIYKKFFGRMQVHVCCCVCIVLGVASAGVDLYCKCYLFKAEFAWKFRCPASGSPSCLKLAILFDDAWMGFLTAFIPFINFLTFFQYAFIRYRNRRNMQNEYKFDKQDASLFLQVFAISTVLVAYFCFYWYTEKAPGGAANGVDAIMWFFGISNSAVNAFTYALFNSDIRSRLCFIRKKKNAVTDSSSPGDGASSKRTNSTAANNQPSVT